MASSEALLPISSFTAAFSDCRLKVGQSVVTCIYVTHIPPTCIYSMNSADLMLQLHASIYVYAVVQKRNSTQLTFANDFSSVADHIANCNA